MDMRNGRDEDGRITPQRAFEEGWITARTYAVNVTRRYILENPDATLAGLLEIFEAEKMRAEQAYQKRVNSNGSVVDIGGPFDK
jgi:hypothetical protein